MSITLRCIPLRFGWTLTQAGVVLGLVTGFNVLVILVFLPMMGHMLSKGNERSRDLILARISAILLVAGQTIFAVPPSITVALLSSV